jgi:hypothetical protein
VMAKAKKRGRYCGCYGDISKAERRIFIGTKERCPICDREVFLYSVRQTVGWALACLRVGDKRKEGK